MAILTVHTKLLENTLEGARIIDTGSTKSCECYVLHRDKVAEIGKKQPRLRQYGFYILLGKDKNGKKMAYVGQTNDFTNRVIDHKQKKEFWDTALVFVSKSNEIYPSEALYLEYLGWKAATEAGNFIIDNSKDINEPPLSEDKQNEMELFFEDIQFLTRFYGCKVFDKPESKIDTSGSSTIFEVEIKKRGIKAYIQYYPESKKYTLLEGSLISAVETSCADNAKRIRRELINNPEICKKEGNLYRVIKSTVLPIESGRPSLSSDIITGASTQGPVVLKTKEGKTFAELYDK